jgi:hypothetical protein
VKQNKGIKGIITSQRKHKISEYADSTSFALDGTPKSLFAAQDTLDFSKLSGQFQNQNQMDRLKKVFKQNFHNPIWKLDWGCTTFSLLNMHSL